MAAAIFQGKSAIMLFSIVPLMVGAMVDQLGFETGSTGYVISAEIAGISLANVAGFFWVNRLPWRRTVRTLLCLLIVANLISAMITGYQNLIIARALCGLVEGSVLALSFAMLARTEKPDRSFGLYFGVSLMLGAINFRIGGWLLDLFGMPGLFVDLAAVCLIPLVLSKYIPNESGAAFVRDHSEAIRGTLFALILVILLANLVYFIGQSGVWSYLERLGLQKGLTSDVVEWGLSASLLAGVAGALSASWQDNRFGRVQPLATALLMALASVAILARDQTVASFYIAVILFNFANNYGHPYLLGYLAEIDSKGRYVVASGAMQTGGMALGPAVAGYFIVGTDVTNSLWVGTIAFTAAIVLFMPIMILIRGHSAAMAFANKGSST